MFRNMYDSDITTWSPQGRIHQVEYAMEAVKQGSAAIGLKSRTHAVVVTLKRASSDLSSYQRKIFALDSHMGIAIAGLTADARVLSKYMRTEALNHKFVYSSPIQVQRLVVQVADKSQVHTQRYGRRPYGVGLLVIGYDQTGAHLFETCPSGNYFDYKAIAIGARNQSAKTYLERQYTQFENLSMRELIKHGLRALRETLGSQHSATPESLTALNTAVGVVGRDFPFTILDGDAILPYLDELDADSDHSTQKTEEKKEPTAESMETS